MAVSHVPFPMRHQTRTGSICYSVSLPSAASIHHTSTRTSPTDRSPPPPRPLALAVTEATIHGRSPNSNHSHLILTPLLRPLSVQMASECIWSDPAGEDQEESGELGIDGFGESPRGGGTICFGNKALDDFLSHHQLSYIIRAHEAHAYGVSLSKRARCFTVFSTSKDHNQGSKAICGYVFCSSPPAIQDLPFF